MTREYQDDDALQDRKKAILARINRKYNSNAGSIDSLNKYTKLHPIDSAEDSFDSESRRPSLSKASILVGGESREDYIKKLKDRIKQLEQAPLERMGSSRFDFESDDQQRKHDHTQRSGKGRDKNNSEKGAHEKNLKPISQPQRHDSKDKKGPPKSPPISTSGSYDISKYKLLDPIPSPATVKSAKTSTRSSYSSKSSIPENDPSMRLAQCDICSRNFRMERLDKHREACEKTHKKKRTVFDGQKMRIKGTELETFKTRAPEGYFSDTEVKPKKGIICKVLYFLFLMFHRKR